MLTTFEGWPGGDEALQGFFAIDLCRHWNWQIFYTTGQHPPLWIWLLSLFYRFSSDSAFNLWFPSALVSSLFVLVAALAGRSYLPKGSAWVWFLILAFGFWPLLFGRACVQADFVPLFEALCFLCLGALGKVKNQFSVNLLMAVLGFFTAAGTYSYMGFLSVLLVVSLLVAAWAWGKQERLRPAVSYYSTLLFLCVPWVLAAFREHLGGYIQGASPWGSLFHWKDTISQAASYFTVLFWGPLGSPAGYGPVWGGFLNPVETSFFLLGVVYFLQEKRWAILGAFFLFLLPGFLTADQVEMLRVIAVMPLLYLIVCAGFFSVWRQAGKGAGKSALILLGILSIGLNLYHLAIGRSPDGPFSHKYSLQERVNEDYWAYRRLKEEALSLGPGLVYSDFLLLDRTHALEVMTYPFNALLNFRLDPAQTQWAGLPTNFHYGVFLQRRFPDSQWAYVTPPGAPPERKVDGGSVVGIFNLTKENRAVFWKWSKAQLFFHTLGLEAENSMDDLEKYSRQVAQLPSGYALMEGDPFLESVYGEWVAQYHMGLNLKPNEAALERAVQKGYPAANLYFKLGTFFETDRRNPEARMAFSQALLCQPNRTQAAEYLRALNP